MWLTVQSLIVNICDIMKVLFLAPASVRMQFVNSEVEVEEIPLSLLFYATPAKLLIT